MQRLNVGLSRARECMHFFISKPVEEFQGSIGRALAHYHKLLADRSLPEANDTDPASPMEARVLDWLKKTAFFQVHRDHIELKAQFKVGEYLRQLDPTYHHPSWRTDFLLLYRDEEREMKIIIEYDGFAEHFTNGKQVHEGNQESFYRAQDIERQLTIESYGYKFLRINRFNLGEDPVEILSQRLQALIGAPIHPGSAEGVDAVLKRVQSVEDGEGKICPRCTRVKPISSFFDRRLGKGAGGYGRICTDCKAS